MGFVDRRAGLRCSHATGIDPAVAGVEEHGLVAITSRRPERHAGALSEGSGIEGLRLYAP